MPPRIVFRPLCVLVFGHEPVIEINEPANKSEYVCERCRAVLGDFVTNLRKSTFALGSEKQVVAAAGHPM